MIASLSASLILPSGADAGTFTVKNCIDESPAFSVAASYAGGTRVEALDCNEPGSPGLLQLNGRAGHTDEGEFGAWRWQAPEGTAIVSATVKARLRNAGGWAAQLFAVRPAGSPLVFGTAPGSGDFDVYYLYETQLGSTGATRVDASLKCYRAGGCDLDALGGATNRPDNILLTVNDRVAPVATASGALIRAAARLGTVGRRL